jgi:ribosomal protein S9
LLEVKANVNMIAVKMMEANAKMLAATKAGAITVNNNNMNVATGDDYLKQILSEPMASTDEY